MGYDFRQSFLLLKTIFHFFFFFTCWYCATLMFSIGSLKQMWCSGKKQRWQEIYNRMQSAFIWWSVTSIILMLHNWLASSGLMPTHFYMNLSKAVSRKWHTNSIIGDKIGPRPAENDDFDEMIFIRKCHKCLSMQYQRSIIRIALYYTRCFSCHTFCHNDQSLRLSITVIFYIENVLFAAAVCYWACLSITILYYMELT